VEAQKLENSLEHVPSCNTSPRMNWTCTDARISKAANVTSVLAEAIRWGAGFSGNACPNVHASGKKRSRRAGHVPFLLLMSISPYCPQNRALLTERIYAISGERYRYGAEWEDGRNDEFEDSVNFRSYGPQLFNHRAILPLHSHHEQAS